MLPLVGWNLSVRYDSTVKHTSSSCCCGSDNDFYVSKHNERKVCGKEREKRCPGEICACYIPTEVKVLEPYEMC